MKKYLKYFIAIIFISFLSCSKNKTENKHGEILAQTKFSILYKDDIEIPENTDSIQYIKDYVKEWLTKELLFNEAEKYLSENEIKNIDKLVNDYKEFLYISHYKQFYIDKNLDTIIKPQDFEEYYNEHKALFILPENIIKGIFIKIPRTAPKIWRVRKWVASNKESDIELLNSYCVQYADKFDDFDGEWITFSKVLSVFPKKINNQEYTLKHKTFIETRDTSAYYYLDIDSFKLANDTAPLEFVKPQITKKIIAKRKKDLILNLKNNIFEDAKSSKKITVSGKYK